MKSFSQQTQLKLKSALEAFSRGDISSAKSILDNSCTSEECSWTDLNDLFAIRCVRASIAAMEGERCVTKFLVDSVPSALHRSVVLYLEGLAAMADGIAIQTARVKFEEAIHADQHFVLARLGLAAVNYRMERYKESFSNYRAVLETLGSASPSIVRVGMALCAYHINNLDYAQKCLERALEVNPDDELALLVLLVVFLDRRQIQSVIDVVRRLRNVLPENAIVLLKVADIAYFSAVSQNSVRSLAPSIRLILAKVRRVATVEEAAMADYQEGRLCLALGDLSNTQVMLQSAMQVLSNLLAARIHYARFLLLSGREADAEQLLLRLNTEHPNHKEILQLLAALASQCGQHQRALEYSKRLTEVVAPGDIRSWSLASWCARVEKKDAKKMMTHVARLQREVGETVSMHLLANIAALSGDVDALQNIVDRELGSDILLQPKLSVAHVPLVYNLALLLEQIDRSRARQLYVFLVKQHGCFRLPYLRLYSLAKDDGLLKQAIAWLVLLQQVIPDEPMSLASIGEMFFQNGRVTAAMSALRSATGRRIPVALALGATFLWCSQQHGKGNRRFLASAKDRFAFALRRDKGNILAAHGLACCLGLEADYDRCQCLLDRVREVRANCDYVRRNHEAHMANVKTLSESFKQAIDYFERDVHRTPLQTSLLAFCLACEGRYNDAIAVLTPVVAENPNLPLMQYNLALFYCAAFVFAVGQKEALTTENARELRHSLATGLSIAAEFVRNEPRSQAMAVARTFLKSACSYCLDLNDRCINRLIVAGQRDIVEYERQCKLWQHVYATFQSGKREAEEQRLAQKRQREEQELQVAREILMDYRRAQCDQPTVLDDHKQASLEAYCADFDFADGITANGTGEEETRYDMRNDDDSHDNCVLERADMAIISGMDFEGNYDTVRQVDEKSPVKNEEGEGVLP